MLIALGVSLLGIFTLIFSREKKKDSLKEYDQKHVNENSFQNYAKFYGEIYPHEDDFDIKLNKIYSLIKDDNIRDIKDIANKSDCSVIECVIKIKYLKNKRLIEDFYIDTNNFKLISCSAEDQALLDKYKPYIYGTHTQIDEFYYLIPNSKYLSREDRKKEILDELLYLDKKNLLNGIKIDDIDGTIIYYALEKRKSIYNKETVHCDNCGALNDVEITGKVRCSYCNSIVKGSKFGES